MPRKKRYRLDTVKNLQHVLEFEPAMKGQWEKVFDNKHPIVLELGCGRGELTLGLAKLYPKKNFIGVDKKADRLWFGGTAAAGEQLSNVRFLRVPIEKIAEAFAKEEVSEIWVTFPDPFPRRRDAKRRLVSPEFLERYRQIIKGQSFVHLKTDAESLFIYFQEVLHKQKAKTAVIINDIYAQDPARLDPSLLIQTTYEKRHLANGKKIFYTKSTID